MIMALGWISSCKSVRTLPEREPVATSEGCGSLYSYTSGRSRVHFQDLSGRDLSFNTQFYVHADSGIYLTASFFGLEVARGWAGAEGFSILNRLERVAYTGDAATYQKVLGIDWPASLFFLLFTGRECVANSLSSYRVVQDSSSELWLKEVRGEGRIHFEKSIPGDLANTIRVFGSKGTLTCTYLERAQLPPFLPVSLAWELSDKEGRMLAKAEFLIQETRFNEIRRVFFRIPSQYEIRKM